MTQTPKTLGRTELAQQYFPYILPHSAWQKFRALLLEHPALQHLVSLSGRSSELFCWNIRLFSTSFP